MTLVFINKALNIGDILLFSLDAIDTCCRRVVGAILFLPATMLRIFLVVLLFFISLVLVDKRLLRVLFVKQVSIEKVSRLIFPRIFVLLFSYSIFLKILSINLPGV